MLRFCSAGAAVSSDSHEVSLFRAELLPSSVDEERLRECPATFRGPCPPKVVFDQVQTQLQWQMYLQIKLMYFADKRIRILPTYVVKGLSSH